MVNNWWKSRAQLMLNHFMGIYHKSHKIITMNILQCPHVTNIDIVVVLNRSLAVFNTRAFDFVCADGLIF